MDEEALTPVVGIILMVAVAVVLGAVVFVLVSDGAGGDGAAPPAMSVRTDPAPGALTAALDDDIATVEHRGGHGCIGLDDLQFRLKGTTGPNIPLAVAGDPAQWCPSDILTLQEDGTDVAPGAYVLQIVFTPRETLVTDALIVLD